ncbi:MAG: MGMT family protein [Candidatus Pacebacteria bacterium]|jgi:O-6-methylguanine DNA methyltransferase|nr:MGMT family protein [Candidatus Paceibacterota bacterium]
MSNFSEQVRNVVRAIPAGQVMTYSAVAAAAGNPKAARAVANVMAKNFDPDIPCHRVIRTDGSLGGYNRGGTAVKKEILQKEGAIL